MTNEQKNQKPKSKIKKFFKRAAIVSSIAAGALGLAYVGIPGVKEKINETIVEIIEGYNEKDLVKLGKVENIRYTEHNSRLTFDAVENASAYRIHVTNKTTGDTKGWKTKATEYFVQFDKAVSTGDILEFNVCALGDDKTTKRGDDTIFEYEMKYITQLTYKSIGNRFFRVATGRISFDCDLTELDFQALDQSENTVTIYGKGKDYSNMTVNFKVDFILNMIDKNLQNIDTTHELFNFVQGYANQNSTKEPYTYEKENTRNFVDLGETLIENGALEKYTKDGYEVKSLQYSNGDMKTVNDKVEIEYSGLFTATKGDEVIDFKQAFTIEMDKVEGYAKNDYLTSFKAGEEANITLTDEYVMDAKATKHLHLMEKYLDYEMPQELLETNQKSNFKSKTMNF
ncbi:MAG: hypothetical protein ACOX6H_00915 [Christensenellales bacterium]|jgi:hypothetical protein